MIQTFVSKMLRIPIRGSSVAIKNSSRLNGCNEVGLTMSAVRARSFGSMRCRSPCTGKVRCSIHTTPPNDFHPLIWVVLRPVTKLSAMEVGRCVPKWRRQLPQNKKALFMQAINRRIFRILGTMAFIGGTTFIYYETHLQEVPMVKRRSFHAFSSSMKEIDELMYELNMATYGGEALSASHPHQIRVQRVLERLVNANRDIPEVNDKSWNVTVVARPIRNAFVLPNGQIFVFYGFLDLLKNDDQIAVVLGHEMAHAVLNHKNGLISYSHLLDLLTIAFIVVIGTILATNLVSALVEWIVMRNSLHVLMDLPFSRQLETEADEIGLVLSAKACFDVREHTAVYQLLAAIEKYLGDRSEEWLSTHPDDEVRSAVFEEKMPQAISLRLACKCPPLPAQDPRYQRITVTSEK